MRVLVTGSSGWLGQTLVPRLRGGGHTVVGLDPIASATTDIVGSIVDRGLVRATIRDRGIDAIVHAAARHKPHIETHDNSEFVAVNVQGTLNLLEEAVAPGAKVDRFVFTSTTSLMISQAIRASRAGGARKAVWIDETMTPLRPRNIYGVTKLAAEELCRLFHELHRLPIVVLRTSRFFPETDDMAHAIAQSDENTKASEFLFRRLTVEDAAESHVVALAKAPGIGFRLVHHLGDDAIFSGRLRSVDRRRARRRGALLSELCPSLWQPRLDDVRFGRPRIRFVQGGGKARLRLQDGLPGNP